jgi:hypothetical protein
VNRKIMSNLCLLVSQIHVLREEEILGIRKGDICSEFGLVLMEIALREVDTDSLPNDECRKRWEQIKGLFEGL